MFRFHLIISEKVNYTPFKRLGKSRLWRGTGIHLIRTVIVNESLTHHAIHVLSLVTNGFFVYFDYEGAKAVPSLH
jgi:hypothetical protein